MCSLGEGRSGKGERGGGGRRGRAVVQGSVSGGG